MLTQALTRQYCNHSFTFAAIDAPVVEIDSLNGSAFAGEVYDMAAGSFSESMAQVGLEGFIVSKRHHHITDLDRRVFDSNLDLFKPPLASVYIDFVVVIFEIYLTFT